MYEKAKKDIEEFDKTVSKLLQEIRGLKHESQMIIDIKNEQIKDLKSDKNGCLQVLRHLEKEIKKELFMDAKINLIIQYNELLKTYNRIEEKEHMDFVNSRKVW